LIQHDVVNSVVVDRWLYSIESRCNRTY